MKSRKSKSSQLLDLSERETDLHFHLMMAELVEHLQHAVPVRRSLRGFVAKFSDARFFYNQRGEFCLLAGSLK